MHKKVILILFLLCSISFAYFDFSKKPKAKYKVFVRKDGSFSYEFEFLAYLTGSISNLEKEALEQMVRDAITQKMARNGYRLEFIDVKVGFDKSIYIHFKTIPKKEPEFYTEGKVKKFSLSLAGLSVAIMQENYNADIDFRIILPSDATVLKVEPKDAVVKGNEIIWTNPNFAEGEPLVEYLFLPPFTSVEGVVERVKLSAREPVKLFSIVFLLLAIFSFILAVLKRGRARRGV